MRKLLALICVVMILASAAVSAGKLENDKVKYDKAAKEAQAKSEWLQGQITSVSEIKRVLDEEADKAIADYDEKIFLLEETVNRIEENNAKLDAIEAEYAVKRVKLEKRVRDIYINGQISYLDVVFGARDFGDFLTRMDLLKHVLDQDAKLVNSAIGDRAEIEELVIQLEEDKKFQEQQAEFAAKAKDIKISKVEQQQELIDRMENDKSVYDLKYDEMMAASQEIERMIQESRYRAAADELARKNAAEKNKTVSGYMNSDGTTQTYIPTTSGGMILPVEGEITSDYGWRTHPVFGGQKFHSGVDIGAEYGEPIKAAQSGVVSHSGWISGYGNTVMIEHGNGLVSLYGHNQSLAVEVGQRVVKGDVIAYCGSTGNSTGPHCHFEVRLNGETVSPFDYVGNEQN